jgi:ribonuclease E
LRGIEDEASKRRAAEIVVYVATPVAMYLLNHKRERLREIELRYAMRVIIAADDAQIAPQYRVDRTRLRSADELPALVAPDRPIVPPPLADMEPDDEEEEDVVAVADEDEDEDIGEDNQEQRSGEAVEAGGEPSAEEAERRRRKRRRRRRGSKRDENGALSETSDEPETVRTETDAISEEIPAPAEATHEEPAEAEAADGAGGSEGGETTTPSDDDPRNRRRGRRGGRRRRRDNEGDISPFAVPGAEQPDLLPVYAGPTPADPFGGRAFDIFDVMDQVERQAEAGPAARSTSTAEFVNGPEPETSTDDAQLEASLAASVTIEEELPIASEPQRAATEIVNTTAPEPVAEALPAGATAEIETDKPEKAAEPEKTAEPETGTLIAAIPTPANDVVAPEPPPAEPAVKPILVGAGGEPPAERKRGWWRR